MADSFTLNLDLGPLEQLTKELANDIQQKLTVAAKTLARQAHAHMLEEAARKLHTRLDEFKSNLEFEQVDSNTWVITLKEKGRWTDDGQCVVYGESDRHTPSVLTPDGWVKITSIKEGSLVLNNQGKWTNVLKVHDNDLFDFCREEPDFDKTFELFGYKWPKSSRSHKKIVVKCINCHNTRTTTAFSFTDVKISHCTACLKTKQLVHIKIKRQDVQKSLILTEDHPIFTQHGWVLAKELQKTDFLYSPAWGKCGTCGKKVLFGGKWCSGGCFQSWHQNDLLTRGLHVSQDPEWQSQYHRNLGKNKVSTIEDVVEKLISKSGQTVDFYQKNTNQDHIDWIRQYPVASTYDKLGRQHYYFLDFYNSKLKLALEIDGHFHFTERGLSRDNQRDGRLKELGIDTFRVPVRLIKSGEFEQKTLPSLIANHSDDIEMVPIRILQLRMFYPSKYTAFSRRWDITVEEGKSFVCQGLLIHNSPHSMLDDLLASPKAKQGKNGKYIVIPFKHNKGPTKQTPQAQLITGELKQQLKTKKIPYQKIEKNPDGSPKLGLLHSVNLNSSVKGKDSGVSVLKGVSIYQRMGQDNKVQRDILTFRTASASQPSKWYHPGVPPAHIFEETYSWVEKLWQDQILPEIMKGLEDKT